MDEQVATFAVKKGLAQMLKGGVIMDVVTPEQARIAEDAGAVAVMALEQRACRHPCTGGRGTHDRSRIDFKDYGCGFNTGDG